MTHDGRYGVRYAVKIPAWLLRKGRYVELMVTDIGEHGAFMGGAHTTVSPHELVQIVFDLDVSVVVHGVVAHVVAEDDEHGRPAGFGVSLIGVPAGFSAVWREAAGHGVPDLGSMPPPSVH